MDPVFKRKTLLGPAHHSHEKPLLIGRSGKLISKAKASPFGGQGGKRVDAINRRKRRVETDNGI